MSIIEQLVRFAWPNAEQTPHDPDHTMLMDPHGHHRLFWIHSARDIDDILSVLLESGRGGRYSWHLNDLAPTELKARALLKAFEER